MLPLVLYVFFQEDEPLSPRAGSGAVALPRRDEPAWRLFLSFVVFFFLLLLLSLSLSLLILLHNKYSVKIAKLYLFHCCVYFVFIECNQVS